MTGENATVLDDYNKAISIKPDYAEAYTNRATYNYYCGSAADACSDWTKAAALGDQKAVKSKSKFCTE